MVSYRAEHLGIQRTVELRTLTPDYATDGQQASMLQREARIAGSVTHPNLQSIVDTGNDESGIPFLVYEHVQGETLADRLKARGGVMSLEEAGHLMLDVVDALGAMHRAGVVHRKLSLTGVFLTHVRGGGEMAKLQRRGDSAFLSEGGTLDPHDDIEQAVTLFRTLLSGAPGGTVVPAALEAVLQRAILADPRRGFPDADAFRIALAQTIPGEAQLAIENAPTRGRLAGDSLTDDLRRLQKRQSLVVGPLAAPLGVATLELMTTLLSIEAIYRHLGEEKWSRLVDQVPEVDALLPASGRTESISETGVPIQLAGRILAAADRIGGEGDLVLLPELGCAMALRGLRRIHPDLVAGARPGDLIDDFPALWSRMIRQGEAKVIERVQGSARLTIVGQVMPNLELCALMAGFVRGALHATGAERVAVQTAGCQALGDAACVFGVIWDPPS